MVTITPEQRQEIEKAGDEPIRVEDPETNRAYLLVREEVYRQLLSLRHRPLRSVSLRVRGVLPVDEDPGPPPDSR